ncbi:MAG: dTMP kinase [Synergistaceae bacterium]|nr:dTMP kinase [Synergistaceae bacterium]
MFITFEGLDGSGKSTQARMFTDWLNKKQDRHAVLTREPGGWEGVAVLRDIVISGRLKHPWSEAYLFMLDRAEHVANVIQPSLDKGLDVVCERYQDSTIAYQVWGRGLPLEIFQELARLSAFPVPDVTIFFDVPAETALERTARRGMPDTFESEGMPFMTKIREGYLALARSEPERWIQLDCSYGDEEVVFGSLLKALEMRGFFCD